MTEVSSTTRQTTRGKQNPPAIADTSKCLYLYPPRLRATQVHNRGNNLKVTDQTTSSSAHAAQLEESYTIALENRVPLQE